MEVGKGFFKRLFKKEYEDDDDLFTEYEIDYDKEDSYTWNWDNLINDRHLLKLSDDVQREKYIRSLVEQVKDASDNMDKLSEEYNSVTATLKDMDELEALPRHELNALREIAEEMITLENERRKYRKTKAAMTDEQFRALERFADSMPGAYDDVKEAEEQRTKIKGDLKKLDDEKQGYMYRNHELKKEIANERGMMVICLFAAAVCIVMLLVLQFGFKMDTKIGYILIALFIAVAITFIYMRFLDSSKELKKIHRSINRLILLQNTVTIRYVNNKHLLDYLYTKYNTTSAKELGKIWDAYEEEREKRAQNEDNEKQLLALQQEYKKNLKRYRLNDIHTWVHNPLAVTDHKEMVEVRHSYILRRQKLRAQMDYNKRLAKEGETEIRELIQEYPRYSGEVMEMLGRYS
ncbi:MAG: hypothetical protein K6G69_08930 [Lachnospiraceae bacterium]|nr:hypothetical protein [Lachnospiraceae bacterium]